MGRGNVIDAGFHGRCNGMKGPENYRVEKKEGLLVSLSRGGSLYILANNRGKFRIYHYTGNSAYMIGDATSDQLRPDRDGLIRCGLRRFKLHDSSMESLTRFLHN